MKTKKILRVLLVDDEPWVVMGLRKMLLKNEDSYVIEGEAFNGIEAMELLKQKQPDVIILDIRMPGLDGLQLLEEVTNTSSETRVILISGYSEFEYVQKALRLGAVDYLTKPVKYDELEKVLDQIRVEKAEEEEKKESQMLQMETLMEIIQSDRKMTFGEFYKKTATTLTKREYYLYSICFREGTKNYIMDQRIQYKDGVGYSRIMVGDRRMAILVNFDSVEEEDLLDELIGDLAKDAEYIGQSKPAGEDAFVYKYLEQAKIAMETARFIKGRNICHYNKPGTFTRELTEDFVNALRNKDTDVLLRCVVEIQSMFFNGEMLINELVMFYNWLLAYYAENPGEEEYLLNYQDFLEVNMGVMDLLELMRNIILHEELEGSVNGKMIKSIMDEIEHNYRSQISLSELGFKNGVSVGHLSFLIKQETGKTYTEHILERRMLMAKKLLRNETLSIYEVSEQVGYNDYYYFTKLFKKLEGVSPSKYRKKLD